MLSILARGDRVIATARSLDKLNEFTSSLTPDLAQRLRVSQLDVTEGEETIHRKIALMAKFWGRIDVLVNNAGSLVQILLPYPRSQLRCVGRSRTSCSCRGRRVGWFVSTADSGSLIVAHAELDFYDDNSKLTFSGFWMLPLQRFHSSERANPVVSSPLEVDLLGSRRFL